MHSHEHTPQQLNAAWQKQAQLDAENGVIECRVCHLKRDHDQSMTVWRNGQLVFAVCDHCAGLYDLHIGPTDRGIKVDATRKGPLIVGGL